MFSKKNNLDQWTLSELKFVMLNFYIKDELIAGEEMLLNAVIQAATHAVIELNLGDVTCYYVFLGVVCSVLEVRLSLFSAAVV